MRNLLNYFNYLPKKLLTIFAIALLIATPFVANAGWAPDRSVKDWNVPADRTGFSSPVFNSFINVPGIGDERGFYGGKDAAITGESPYLDTIDVGNDGQELLLRTYVHNGANQSLNESGQGIAHDSSVRILVPSGSDRALRSISYVSASNTNPLADT